MFRKSFICVAGVLAGASSGAYSDGFFNEQNVVTDSFNDALEKFGFADSFNGTPDATTEADGALQTVTAAVSGVKSGVADLSVSEMDDANASANRVESIDSQNNPDATEERLTSSTEVDSEDAQQQKTVDANQPSADANASTEVAGSNNRTAVAKPANLDSTDNGSALSAEAKRAAMIAEAEKALADAKALAAAEAKAEAEARAEAEAKAIAAAKVAAEEQAQAAAKKARETAEKLKQAELARAQAIVDVRFSKEVYESPSGDKLLYRKLTPRVKGEQELPLVIFLHGMGERGDDNQTQLKHGLRYFASAEGMQKYPATVIVPQCPGDQLWSTTLEGKDGSPKMSPQPTDPMRLVMELLDSIQLTDPVDPDRIYLTGLSMGGYGTFDLIARRPTTFAAAAPLCGGGDSSRAIVKRMTRTPLWVIHGSDDQAVNVNQSRAMVYALEELGGSVRYSEFDGFGHNVWDATYSDAEFYKWMFNQSRGGLINADLERKQIQNALLLDGRTAAAEALATRGAESSVMAKPESQESKRSANLVRNPNFVAKTSPADRASAGDVAARELGQSSVVSKPLSTETAGETSEGQPSNPLIGQWKVLAASQKGQQAGPKILANMKVEIEGDSFVIKIGEQQEVAKFRLNPSEKFQQIDILSNRDDIEDSKGIYQIKGDRLIICWGLPGRPRPTQFVNFMNVKSLVLQKEE